MQLVLTTKAQKLMRVCSCEIEGENPFNLMQAAMADCVAPAICMTEGCEYTAKMEKDQDQGYCEVCGGNTVMSALRLADII